MQPITNDIGFLLVDDCWFSAPAERTPRFKGVFLKVSRALHQSLRDTLAPMLFSDLQRLANLDDGYPLLFYYASRPFHSKTEYSYDVLDDEKMEKFFRLATPRFQEVIAEVWDRLKAAGLDKIAEYYRPSRVDRIIAAIRGKERFRRRLYQMLVSEARLFSALTRFGGLANCSPKVRARECAQFIQDWNMILRRFYAGRDFTAASPTLLRAATLALVTAQRRGQNFDEDFSEQQAA
jgi:hypothetical protein